MGMRISSDLERKCLELAGQLPPALVASDVDEKPFQDAVIDIAKRNGWKCYHTFSSRKSEKGFPDLVLVRDRVIVRELKAEAGIVGAEQANWIEAFKAAGIDAGVWRPSMWSEIEAALR